VVTGEANFRRLDGGFYRRGGGGRLSRHRFRFAGKEDGGSDCAEDQNGQELFFFMAGFVFQFCPGRHWAGLSMCASLSDEAADE